jgi:hypothetical protein
LILVVSAAGAGILVSAQTVQVLPEIDAHVTIGPYAQTYLQAKDDRDAGATDQFSIGPSMQLYLKSLVTLKRITAFDLDDARRRPLVFEAGYRCITAPGEPTTERMEAIVTPHFPLKGGALIADRNRADLEWKGGEFSWRYRNKLRLERTFTVHSYHLIPYIAAEPYYVEQYSKWSTTALFVGSNFPVGKHVQLEAYYEHENNTGKSPNQQQNSFGLVLNLYYSVRSK